MAMTMWTNYWHGRTVATCTVNRNQNMNNTRVCVKEIQDHWSHLKKKNVNNTLDSFHTTRYHTVKMEFIAWKCKLVFFTETIQIWIHVYTLNGSRVLLLYLGLIPYKTPLLLLTPSLVCRTTCICSKTVVSNHHHINITITASLLSTRLQDNCVVYVCTCSLVFVCVRTI